MHLAIKNVLGRLQVFAVILYPPFRWRWQRFFASTRAPAARSWDAARASQTRRTTTRRTTRGRWTPARKRPIPIRRRRSECHTRDRSRRCRRRCLRNDLNLWLYALLVQSLRQENVKSLILLFAAIAASWLIKRLVHFTDSIIQHAFLSSRILCMRSLYSTRHKTSFCLRLADAL